MMVRRLSTLLIVSYLISLVLASFMQVARQDARKQIQPEVSKRDSTNGSFLRVGDYGVECNGALYGDDLSIESCLSAVEGMSKARSTYSWGPRGGSTKLITPIRILSRTWTP